MLRISVSDGGDPPRYGLLDIQINVIDVNDNSPMFDTVAMTAELVENSALQTIVFHLHATDNDADQNGDVIYSLREHGAKACSGLFDISNTTGVVRVKGHIDYEVITRCTLVAVARDRGQGLTQLSAEMTLTVNIVDENDNAPQVSINTLTTQDASAADVAEDVEVSTVATYKFCLKTGLLMHSESTVLTVDSAYSFDIGQSISKDLA